MDSNSTTLTRREGRFYQLTRDPILFISVILIFGLLLLFIIYPLYSAVKLSLTPGGKFSFSEYSYVFSHSGYTRTILNSVTLGALVATLATVVGFIFAYAMTKANVGGKRFFQSMGILPIISPPFMFALSVILLFGRNGLISAKLLGLDTGGIYGLRGLIIVQVITMYPIAYMTLVGILQGIDPDLETCAMNLGAKRGHTFWTVTFPLALPGIFASWLLVFVGSLTDFGNPIIIGGEFDVLSVKAYLEFTGMGNLPRGAALAILLLIPTVFVFFIQKYIMKNKSYVTITGKSSRRGSASVSKATRRGLFIFCLSVSVFVLLFYTTIIGGSFVKLWSVDWTPTLKWFAYSFDVGFTTLKNTLFLAIVQTPITALLGMVIAFIVVRKSFPGKGALDFLSMISYAIPGTAIGIGYILAFNKAPFDLSGTAFILVAVYVFRNVPIGVQGGIAALKQISTDIEESSTNLGATTAYTFRKITLPLIRPSFFAGATFAFVRAMTAISAIIFLVSARWNHLTVLILAQTEIMRLGAASVLSFALIVVVVGFIFLIMKLTGLKQSQIFGTTN